MATFIGIVHKEDDSDYGVCFPDFPGCTSVGKDMEELSWMAEEALRGHIEVMEDYGDPLPTRPMTLDAARAHEFAKDAALFIAVEAPLPSKPIRVNVMLDQNLLKRIDRIAKNRSAFLSQAALHELERRV